MSCQALSALPGEILCRTAGTIGALAMARKRLRISEPFGARLARLRRERNITQDELARRVGLAQPNISAYEGGRFVPSGPLIIRLARILEVSADQLLGVEPVKRNGPPLDRSAARRLRQIDRLSRRDRQALLRTIDAYLTKAKVTAGNGSGSGR